jgi:hypothetical protein
MNYAAIAQETEKNMLRIKYIALLLLGIFLAACGGRTPVQEADTPIPPTETAAVSSTSTAAFTTACTVVSALPTPSPEELSLFPPISADEHSLGPDSATVTIVEYSDFQ